MSDDKKTFTLKWSNYDFLCDLKAELQKITRAKLRIDFDNTIEFLKAKTVEPQLTPQIYAQRLIKLEEEKKIARKYKRPEPTELSAE